MFFTIHWHDGHVGNANRTIRTRLVPQTSEKAIMILKSVTVVPVLSSDKIFEKIIRAMEPSAHTQKELTNT